VTDINLLFEGYDIYRTQIASWKFSYRLLTLHEYKVLRGLLVSQTLDQLQVYLEAFKRCYIGNSDFLNSKTPVGVYLSVGRLIMYLSGDCEQDTLKTDIQIARSLYATASVQERMRHTIFIAFPSYTIDDTEKWSRPDLIRKFIIAENALLQRGTEYIPLDVNEILSPEEFEIAQKQITSQQKKKTQHIDFKKESSELESELGFWNKWDREEAEVLKEKGGLTVSQAQKLDKMRPARR
jgi:hypothetical protein